MIDPRDFLDEMEMRSAHASYIAIIGEKEPWFGWSFKRYDYHAVVFVLRMLYGFREASADDLYGEGL